MSFRHILSPIQIGEVEIPNRVVRTAHGTDIGHYKVNEEPDRLPSGAREGAVSDCRFWKPCQFIRPAARVISIRPIRT